MPEIAYFGDAQRRVACILIIDLFIVAFVLPAAFDFYIFYLQIFSAVNCALIILMFHPLHNDFSGKKIYICLQHEEMVLIYINST
ncbi:hypothetical protein ACJX0J_018507, partial [Zea mays]